MADFNKAAADASGYAPGSVGWWQAGGIDAKADGFGFGDFARVGAAVGTGGLSEAAKYGFDKATGRENDFGEFYGGIVDKVSGADAARTQQQAYEEAMEQSRADLEAARASGHAAVESGRGYIDQGFGQAAGAYQQGGQGAMGALGGAHGQSLTALLGGEQGAMGHLGAGREASLGDLMRGYSGAQGAVGGIRSRSGELYDGGLGAGFQADPGYQFRLQQGEQAINRAAAARGGRMGGATLKALMDHGQGLASQEFDRYAQRQMGMAGAADQSDMTRGMALADIMRGYGQQAAGINQQAAQGMAGYAAGFGQQRAGMESAYGQQLAGQHSTLAGQLGALYQQQGLAQSGLGMQQAQLDANTAAAVAATRVNPYAGAPEQAKSNFLTSLAGTGFGILTNKALG